MTFLHRDWIELQFDQRLILSYLAKCGSKIAQVLIKAPFFGMKLLSHTYNTLISVYRVIPGGYNKSAVALCHRFCSFFFLM